MVRMPTENEWLEYWSRVYEQSKTNMGHVGIAGRTYTNAAEMKNRLEEMKR